MAIEVGNILDKYELLEEVGQGGMAVVYRGLDRSLRREVAVKVLHKHLASHQEARDRFEREAHAVAKLRHENILEIFDFSSDGASESYIVTEFIDGQTLRQFINEHQIKYPEIGALITAQVCKALVHAHGLGILHRDIKPENIMIRRDGVVKLMDFGIAQMVDLQRMTVTGQLLGSPAYMSPEHVEGKPLDFRTDVFSVGILLYQLVTGELPFSGRNAHEILKRIADCRFRPAQQMNPRVGKELDRIICRAMAREPADRYPDISEMLTALEHYLAASGLEDHAEELSHYFAAPPSYELALRARLLDALSRRGKKLLDSDRVEALELFNRVLTIDPDNSEVLAEIDRISRRDRGRRVVLALGAIALVGGGLWGARALLGGDDDRPVAPLAVADAGALATAPMPTGFADAAVATAPLPAAVDAAVAATPPDARTVVASKPDRPIRHTSKPDRRPEPADAAVAVTPPPTRRRYRLNVYPKNSEYRLPGGSWTKIPGQRTEFEASSDIVTIDVRNPTCCQSQTKRIAEAPGGVINVTLGWLPARLTLKCAQPGARAQIDNRGTPIGRPTEVPIGDSAFGHRTVEVVFFTDDASKFDKKTVKLRYRESKVVECAF